MSNIKDWLRNKILKWLGIREAFELVRKDQQYLKQFLEENRLIAADWGRADTTVMVFTHLHPDRQFMSAQFHFKDFHELMGWWKRNSEGYATPLEQFYFDGPPGMGRDAREIMEGISNLAGRKSRIQSERPNKPNTPKEDK